MNRALQARCSQGNSRQAFTLVELLIVVALIMVLIAMMVPAFNAGLDKSELAWCQSNNHHFIIAYMNYSSENRGGLVGGQPGGNADAFVRDGPGEAPILNGAMWPYLPNLKSWRCPASPYNGNTRTYDIIGPLRGEGWSGQAGTDRLAGIANLARQMLCFEEEDVRGWNVGSWLIDLSQYRWIDCVGLYHANQTADDIGFLDGHVERWVWSDEGMIANAKVGSFYYTSAAGTKDWDRVRAVYRNMPTSGGILYIP